MVVAEGDFRRWLTTVAPNIGLTTLSTAAGHSQLPTPAEAGWETGERVRWLQGLTAAERLQLLENRTHAAIVRE